MDKTTGVGVVGAGTMGSGIAQVAATFGHEVVLHDSFDGALERAEAGLKKIMARLVEKGRLVDSEAGAILQRISYSREDAGLSNCDFVIEAIVEDIGVKKDVFERLESVVNPDAILATNTSSLSVAAISAACKIPERVLGVHFFNPAPLMPLVEIVPGVSSDSDTVQKVRALIDAWGKTTVIAKDTPGFIVNRVARPFYGEALRILDEGIADAATIDWAMKEIAGFKMGPFELMDFIGHDVNYAVTESVFAAFYNDPRYRPSLTQKRLMEANLLGRKSGRGFYDYRDGAPMPEPVRDTAVGGEIVNRIVAMLINEAADAVFWNIASCEDIELAMTRGVRYPRGLLGWADEIGIKTVLDRLDTLHAFYGDDRYRPSPLMRKMAAEGSSFF